MKFEHELITKEEVAQALEKARLVGKYIGKNPDASRLFDFIASIGGFKGEHTAKGISRLGYAFSPTEAQQHNGSENSSRYADYGTGRWDNLRRGHKHFTLREANFVHLALTYGAGHEWGMAFEPIELVTSPFDDFLQKALTLGLPWPDGKIPPSVAMDILQASQSTSSLTIKPVNPSSTRLGGPPDGDNQFLESANKHPVHKSGEYYFLQIRGLKPAKEQAFIFQTSNDDLVPKRKTTSYSGFPVALVAPRRASHIVKSKDEGPFVFYNIEGFFSFFVVTFPSNWDFQEHFGCDPTALRWSRKTFDGFVNSLRKKLHDQTNGIRIGWYGHFVEC